MKELNYSISSNFNPSRSNSTLTPVIFSDKLCLKKQSHSNVHSEFSMIESLSHENIIQVHIQDTAFSFIMEICSKGDLKPTKPIFSHKDLASTFRQLCKAVQYLHSLNISHLDLKLENFVKDDQDVIKLIDFEHAQRAERVQQEKGTWLYNSPERKEGNYDGKKADIFSLGICLMGLLVGFIPVSAGNVNFANSQRFLNDNDSFWDGLYTMMQKKHAEFDGFYEQDIELINEMVCQDPNKRPSIDEVLERGFFLLM